MFFDGPDVEKFTRYHWECARCGTMNDTDHIDCEFYTTGIKPDIQRNALHDKRFNTMTKYFIVLMSVSITLLLIIIALR